MAFDGITVANIVKELNDRVLNGRLSKIAQPEEDEPPPRWLFLT